MDPSTSGVSTEGRAAASARGARSGPALAVVGVAALVANGVLGMLNVERIVRANDELVHAHEVLHAAEGLVSALKDAETGQRGYLITGAPAYLEPYEAGVAASGAELGRLEELTRDEPEQRSRVDAMRAIVGRKLDELRRTVELRRRGPGGFEAARAVVLTDEGKHLMDELRSQIATVSAAEQRLRDGRVREARTSSRLAIALDAVGTLASLALVGWAFVLMRARQRERERAAERLAVTLRSIGDAVIATDTHARVTIFNRVAEQLTGWTAEEAVGRPLEEVFRIVNEHTRRPAASPVERVLREGVIVGLANHTALLARDGTERPIADSGAPIRDADGRTAGVVLVFRDQTAEQRSREVQARLAAIVESTDDAIVSTDLARRILTWNTGAERLLGYAAGEVVGQPIDVILPPERRHEEDDLLSRVTSGERVTHFETRRVTKAGAVLDVSITVSPLRDEGGSIFGASKIIRDISAQKRASEALLESDRRKNEFIGVLSHELRNPLAPIRNGLYLLDRVPPGSDAATRARAIVQRQVEQLTRLIDDLLDVTRISRGKIELRRSRIDLRDVVRRASEDHRALFEERRLALRLELSGPVWTEADETRIAQIVGNLLQNASKFSREGGAVTVAVDEADGKARIRVRDDGIGIPRDLLPRVFEPFVQAAGGLARTQGGLGLGLSLVKGLVELHGGAVTAHSDGPERGAEFAVTLPLAPALAPPAPAPRPAAAARPLEILVIEDNVDAAESVADVLRLEGHRVHVATDGVSGIAKARDLKPEVVLCDIGLPDVDGYEIARTLRADEGLRAVRLIALSGYAAPEDRRRAAEAGFDDHLAKPASMEALLASVAAGARAGPGEATT